MSRFGNHATLEREQWQLLVDVLDGHYDERTLEEAQDALTRAAPLAWLEEAEAADEDRRAAEERGKESEFSEGDGRGRAGSGWKPGSGHAAGQR